MNLAVTMEALKKPAARRPICRTAGGHRLVRRRARQLVHNLLVIFMGAFLAAYPFLESGAVGAAGGYALEWAFVTVAGFLGILLFWLEGRH